MKPQDALLPFCPKCRYDLHAISDCTVCPECGTEFPSGMIMLQGVRWYGTLGMLFVVWIYASVSAAVILLTGSSSALTNCVCSLPVLVFVLLWAFIRWLVPTTHRVVMISPVGIAYGSMTKVMSNTIPWSRVRSVSTRPMPHVRPRHRQGIAAWRIDVRIRPSLRSLRIGIIYELRFTFDVRPATYKRIRQSILAFRRQAANTAITTPKNQT